jgi:hypothetical protein
MSLPREQEGMGNPDDDYAPEYSYHYVYGVTHDLPDS